jgi:hypothetical protein
MWADDSDSSLVRGGLIGLDELPHDLDGVDGGRVNSLPKLSGRDFYIDRIEHLLDSAPQDAADDAFPNLDGPALYAARLVTLCEASAKRFTDELEYRRSLRKVY